MSGSGLMSVATWIGDAANVEGARSRPRRRGVEARHRRGSLSPLRSLDGDLSPWAEVSGAVSGVV